jgi:hypothetical protein
MTHGRTDTRRAKHGPGQARTATIKGARSNC